MNAKTGILSFGILFFIIVVVLAMMPDDFWDHDLPEYTSMQTPLVVANNQNQQLARNNTVPAINQMFQRSPKADNAVNAGVASNILMQPIVAPNNQFDFAGKTNNLNPVAFAQNQQLNNNQQAVNSIANNNTYFAPNMVQQAPVILSDAFPPATHKDGRNTHSCTLCHQVQRADMTGKERLTNNNTVVADSVVNYAGLIQKVTNVTSVNGLDREHIWIRSQTGETVEIIMAPNWFLNFIHCPLANNKLVKGTAFQLIEKNQGNSQQTNIFYAKELIVDGRLCSIRDDKGLPLWSN